MKDIVRINLLSGPRNISTALMYSFAQRMDCMVYDEPLYAYYLKHSQAKAYHPGAEEIMNSQENDGEKVIEMMLGGHPKPIVFFKNMSHHLLTLDRVFMKDMVNVILTRDPLEMLPSFAKVIPNPKMGDVGYALHLDLYQSLQQMGAKVLVVDAKKLLRNPALLLEKLCNEIGIPFSNEMLSWEKGPIKEDGIWAKYWYSNVHQSRGFQKYQPKTYSIPKNMERLYEECKKLYNNMIDHSI